MTRFCRFRFVLVTRSVLDQHSRHCNTSCSSPVLLPPPGSTNPLPEIPTHMRAGMLEMFLRRCSFVWCGIVPFCETIDSGCRSQRPMIGFPSSLTFSLYRAARHKLVSTCKHTLPRISFSTHYAVNHADTTSDQMCSATRAPETKCSCRE